MKADRVEVSRDESGDRWVVRIQVGAEVIRRHTKDPKDANQDTLRNAAITIAADEGYTVDPTSVVFS